MWKCLHPLHPVSMSLTFSFNLNVLPPALLSHLDARLLPVAICTSNAKTLSVGHAACLLQAPQRCGMCLPLLRRGAESKSSL